MDMTHYEQMLKNPSAEGRDAEAKWDARADEFYDSQREKESELTDRVTEFLLTKGLLGGLDVLDVGGGAGRYAVPFAAYAKKVVMTDISGRMLERAKENAERAGRSNLEYVKLDWAAADPAASGWGGRFDLVFASMCPAVGSREGIDKMSFVSGGRCVINRMIESKDTVAEILREELAIRPSYDPHNDRDSVQGIFNILWLQGYEPEIAYLKERVEARLSVEEAASRYARKFGEAAAEKGLSLRDLLSGCAEGGEIVVENRTTLAMIFWKARTGE